MEAQPNYQTVEGIQQHPLFKSMTDKQQRFAVKFFETGDRLAAVYAGYGTHFKNEKAARIRAHRVLRYSTMTKLLNIFEGEIKDRGAVTKQELIELTSCRLREKDLTIDEFLQLSRLFLQVQQWRKKKSNSSQSSRDEAEDVISLVQKMEKERNR